MAPNMAIPSTFAVPTSNQIFHSTANGNGIAMAAMTPPPRNPGFGSTRITWMNPATCGIAQCSSPGVVLQRVSASQSPSRDVVTPPPSGGSLLRVNSHRSPHRSPPSRMGAAADAVPSIGGTASLPFSKGHIKTLNSGESVSQTSESWLAPASAWQPQRRAIHSREQSPQMRLEPGVIAHVAAGQRAAVSSLSSNSRVGSRTCDAAEALRDRTARWIITNVQHGKDAFILQRCFARWRRHCDLLLASCATNIRAAEIAARADDADARALDSERRALEADRRSVEAEARAQAAELQLREHERYHRHEELGSASPVHCFDLMHQRSQIHSEGACSFVLLRDSQVQRRNIIPGVEALVRKAEMVHEEALLLHYIGIWRTTTISVSTQHRVLSQLPLTPNMKSLCTSETKRLQAEFLEVENRAASVVDVIDGSQSAVAAYRHVDKRKDIAPSKHLYCTESFMWCSLQAQKCLSAWRYASLYQSDLSKQTLIIEELETQRVKAVKVSEERTSDLAAMVSQVEFCVSSMRMAEEATQQERSRAEALLKRIEELEMLLAVRDSSSCGASPIHRSKMGCHSDEPTYQQRCAAGKILQYICFAYDNASIHVSFKAWQCITHRNQALKQMALIEDKASLANEEAAFAKVELQAETLRTSRLHLAIERAMGLGVSERLLFEAESAHNEGALDGRGAEGDRQPGNLLFHNDDSDGKQSVQLRIQPRMEHQPTGFHQQHPNTGLPGEFVDTSTDTADALSIAFEATQMYMGSLAELSGRLSANWTSCGSKCAEALVASVAKYCLRSWRAIVLFDQISTQQQCPCRRIFEFVNISSCVHMVRFQGALLVFMLLAWKQVACGKATLHVKALCKYLTIWQGAVRLRLVVSAWRQSARCIGLLRWRWRARGLALLRVILGSWRLAVFELKGPLNSSGCTAPNIASTRYLQPVASRCEQVEHSEKCLQGTSQSTSQTERQQHRSQQSGDGSNDGAQKSRNSSKGVAGAKGALTSFSSSSCGVFAGSRKVATPQHARTPQHSRISIEKLQIDASSTSMV